MPLAVETRSGVVGNLAELRGGKNKWRFKSEPQEFNGLELRKLIEYTTAPMQCCNDLSYFA